MKIAIIGSGAMGGLFASLLSQKNDVTIIDLNKELVDKINQDGFILHDRDGSSKKYNFKAVTDSKSLGKQDLIILFVKAMYSQSALESNKNIIGPDTYLLSMQNGMGHEELLSKYADSEHVILGTTQHNASVKALGENIHGGSGPSAISLFSGDNEKIKAIASTFTECSIECTVTEDVKRMIWHKVFTNVSTSVLTGILLKPMGYVRENEYAWGICIRLIKEAVEVAKADGYSFDYDKICSEVEGVCLKSPNGLTSVYADIKNGRKTEVDTISGAVLRKAKKYGVSVPYTEYSVSLLHALEMR